MINKAKLKKITQTSNFQIVLATFIIISVFFCLSVQKRTQQQSIIYVPQDSLVQGKQIALIKGDQEIFSQPESAAKPVTWNNHIFFQKHIQGSGSYSVQFLAYNFSTGETTLLHSISSLYPGLAINDIKIYDDTLYFSYSSHNQVNPAFYVNLTQPKLAAIEYFSGQSLKINKYGDRYILTSHFGDPGLEDYNFYSFDPVSKASEKIFQINDYSLVSAKTFVGIDAKNRIIFASHTGSEKDNYSYKSISYVTLQDPSTEVKLLDTNIFPEGFTSVQYIADSNSLLITGKKNILFNLNSDKIVSKNATANKNIAAASTNYYDIKEIDFSKYNLPSGFTLNYK